jgi:hypothetical protein
LTRVDEVTSVSLGGDGLPEDHLPVDHLDDDAPGGRSGE